MTKVLIGAGCFWGIEEYFCKITGVIDTKVGYSGGHTVNPSYEEVCSGTTEHVEVLQIKYNENIIIFENILEHFWLCHDPTQLNRQGPDVGRQYRSAIFYFTENQKLITNESLIRKQLLLTNTIVTEILPAKEFYLAEEYHQQYIHKRRLIEN
jgi:peptide-methionine (S)-S-oxide reductase